MNVVTVWRNWASSEQNGRDKERGPTTFAEAHGSLGHVVAFRAIRMAVKKADPFPSIYGLRKAIELRF
jgi:hypothetical protein